MSNKQPIKNKTRKTKCKTDVICDKLMKGSRCNKQGKCEPPETPYNNKIINIQKNFKIYDNLRGKYLGANAEERERIKKSINLKSAQTRSNGSNRNNLITLISNNSVNSVNSGYISNSNSQSNSNIKQPMTCIGELSNGLDTSINIMSIFSDTSEISLKPKPFTEILQEPSNKLRPNISMESIRNRNIQIKKGEINIDINI